MKKYLGGRNLQNLYTNFSPLFLKRRRNLRMTSKIWANAFIIAVETIGNSLKESKEMKMIFTMRFLEEDLKEVSIVAYGDLVQNLENKIQKMQADYKLFQHRIQMLNQIYLDE
ncbi:hypothetical protein C5167_040206 [Papaver somniferum]|uniref:Uncharacterized protein n=1 Tax=Papaver somniferum TaxID=3469 RepID=A0A4Y7IIJ5_PAPSO|nr:hypothetical protein C5167_040206 [Papaver somniferum]